MKTPETTRELSDAAWATANGMRIVYRIVDRAQSLVAGVDRAVERGDVPSDGDLIHYADSLRELVGPPKGGGAS